MTLVILHKREMVWINVIVICNRRGVTGCRKDEGKIDKDEFEYDRVL